MKRLLFALLCLALLSSVTLARAIDIHLGAAADPRTVTLYWDANTEPDLAGYKVYWSRTSRIYNNSPVPTVAPSASPTFTTPPLANGTWYFAVTAYNTAGLESVFSNEVSSVIATAPAPPNNLRKVAQAIADALSGIWHFFI
jgi:hypothetical protein